MQYSLIDEDKAVLLLIMQAAIDQGTSVFEAPVNVDTLVSRAESMGISSDRLAQAVQALKEGGYVRGNGFIGQAIGLARLNPRGFRVYAQERVPSFAAIEQQVARTIVAMPQGYGIHGENLATTTGQPHWLVEAVAYMLAEQGDVHVGWHNGLLHIEHVSETLKRQYR